jgi:uncharacterized protein (DUF58 family)
MKMDLARINHILIPESKEARDRLRHSRIGRFLGRIPGAVGSLTREGQTFALVALLAAAFGIDARGTDVYLLFCVLGGAVAASLAVRHAFPMDGVEVDVVAPRRLMVGEIATFVVVCKNRGDTARTMLQASGPFLPWHGRWQAGLPADRIVARLEPGSQGRVELRARFVRRGEHHLDPFEVAARVPFGLALGPPLETPGVRLRVVPRPASIARLTLPAGRARMPGGVARVPRRGGSMDLLGVRPYRAGDPARDLHARSWARTGMPVVREYEQEHVQRLAVVLDVFTQDDARFEAAIAITAGIVRHLARGEALVDLLVAGERGSGRTVGPGLSLFEQALDRLASVKRRPAAEARALAQRMAPRLSRFPSVVFVLLAADTPRRALVERVAAMGVRCARVVVDDATVRAVERGEALSL